MAYHVIYKKTAILFGLTFRAVYNICAAKILNFFHISIRIILKSFNILTIQQLYTPFRTISGAKLSNSGIPAKSCHYTTKFNSERHKMPHFASLNTQHLLKITSNSALIFQNPCTIQINVLPLHQQKPPRLPLDQRTRAGLLLLGKMQ